MKRMVVTCYVILLGLMVSVTAQAGLVQLSLVPEIQLIDKAENVDAIRLAIWGQNNDVKGLDVGLVSIVDGDFVGLGSSFVQHIKGDALGVQWSVWNQTLGSVVGLQLGAVNICEDIEGCQFGIVNMAKGDSSLQIGLVNVASLSSGWQVGLLNINNADDAKFPMMVLVNGSF